MKDNQNLTRRNFLKTSAVGVVGAFAAPIIVPSSVFGANAPSNRINVGAIGCGRQGRGVMHSIMDKADARIIAVCDLDANRLADAKTYTEQTTQQIHKTPHTGVKMYGNYVELIADKEIDAVMIATPDHWHAKLAVDAVYAGKDVYLEKPASLTVSEGRMMSNIVNSTGRIFQIGSQQRSMAQFRIACELVLNGRIGELKTIEVEVPGDPSGGETKEMPIPSTLNYEAWLGQTPWVYYTEDRVHPQQGYGRPGWLRCEQFGAGMITGWGTHHFDIAHWAMGTEYSGPIEVTAKSVFPARGSGLWDVHGKFESEMLYANGVRVFGVEAKEDSPNGEGVVFKGTEGWIYVSRGNYTATATDPVKAKANNEPLQASDSKILKWKPGPNDIQLEVSNDHCRNWLDAIRSRKPAITNAEIAHRSCSVCLIQHISMKLNRKLYWDPKNERFKNDDEANSMLSRVQRYPYNI